MITFRRSHFPSDLSSFSPSLSLTQTLNVVLNKAVICTSVRMGCVGVNMQRVRLYWRAVAIKVQVWEIIHHEMVAVHNLHDRGIQNDVAWWGILQPWLPINHSQPSVTTRLPFPVSSSYTRTQAQRELGNESSQHVIYPLESMHAFWPFGTQRGT